MKRVIRRGVFETNSSSTHSITMCSENEYDKWKNGELLIYDEQFLTKEEAIKQLQNNKWFINYHENFDFSDEDAVNEALVEEGYYTYDKYWEDEELEGYKDSYIAKSGEKIIAFGKYGHD